MSKYALIACVMLIGWASVTFGPRAQTSLRPEVQPGTRATASAEQAPLADLQANE